MLSSCAIKRANPAIKYRDGHSHKSGQKEFVKIDRLSARSEILRCRSACDDLHQLPSDDGLPRPIIQNLESSDHIPSILGSVLHSH